MPKGMSQRAYARHRGVTHASVQKAIAAGRIRTFPDGSVDVKRADRDWARNTDESKASNSVSGDPKHRRPEGEPPQPAENRARLRGQVASAPPAAEPEPDLAVESTPYTRHRTEQAKWDAGLKRLEYEQRVRSLLASADIQNQSFSASRQLRDQLLSVSERLAPTLVGQPDVEACRRILDEEMRRIATELQQALVAALAGGTPS